jgi:hypothetical protein
MRYSIVRKFLKITQNSIIIIFIYKETIDDSNLECHHPGRLCSTLSSEGCLEMLLECECNRRKSKGCRDVLE